MSWDEIAAFAVFVLLVGAVLAAVLSVVGRRDARIRQRLTLLQQALEHPQLDAATRSQILSVLAKEHETSKLQFLKSANFWHRFVFGGGWLVFVFFGGIALLAMSNILPQQTAQLAIAWSLCGFAVLTLPLALRELLRRKSQLAD
jgi:hypothetical protein